MYFDGLLLLAFARIDVAALRAKFVVRVADSAVFPFTLLCHGEHVRAAEVDLGRVVLLFQIFIYGCRAGIYGLQVRWLIGHAALDLNFRIMI